MEPDPPEQAHARAAVHLAVLVAAERQVQAMFASVRPAGRPPPIRAAFPAQMSHVRAAVPE